MVAARPTSEATLHRAGEGSAMLPGRPWTCSIVTKRDSHHALGSCALGSCALVEVLPAR